MTIGISAAPGAELAPRLRSPALDAPSPPLVPDGGSRFAAALESIGAELDRGDRLLGRALTGGHLALSSGDLIALQAGIYRYSEAVDLAAKLVDRSTAALRTTLQSSG